MGAALAAPDPTLPPNVPPQHIEACLGFGCGQCKNRTYGMDAVLPYQLGGKPDPLSAGLFHRRPRRGSGALSSGAPGQQTVSAKGVAFALAKRIVVLLLAALAVIFCADRILARKPRRCGRATRQTCALVARAAPTLCAPDGAGRFSNPAGPPPCLFLLLCRAGHQAGTSGARSSGRSQRCSGTTSTRKETPMLRDLTQAHDGGCRFFVGSSEAWDSPDTKMHNAQSMMMGGHTASGVDTTPAHSPPPPAPPAPRAAARTTLLLYQTAAQRL